MEWLIFQVMCNLIIVIVINNNTCTGEMFYRTSSNWTWLQSTCNELCYLKLFTLSPKLIIFLWHAFAVFDFSPFPFRVLNEDSGFQLQKIPILILILINTNTNHHHHHHHHLLISDLLPWNWTCWPDLSIWTCPGILQIKTNFCSTYQSTLWKPIFHLKGSCPFIHKHWHSFTVTSFQVTLFHLSILP